MDIIKTKKFHAGPNVQTLVNMFINQILPHHFRTVSERRFQEEFSHFIFQEFNAMAVIVKVPPSQSQVIAMGRDPCNFLIKVRKTARIRNRYNQVPHLPQDTKWESNKITINITNKSQDVSPFPSGDHKDTMSRRESMTNTRHK